MLVKGLKFRRSKTVVQLPNFDYATGEKFPHAVESNYSYFGRILKDQTKADPKVHVKTHYYRTNDDDRKMLYAEVIPNNGHSLTNMMYGKDGRVYLIHKGVCYTAKLKTA